MGIIDAAGAGPSASDWGAHQDAAPAVKSKPRPQKRKADHPATLDDDASGSTTLIDLTADSPPEKCRKRQPDEEKRLRRWRAKAPASYHEIRDRALTQRMFVLDRRRNDDNTGHPIETVSLAGTTGNVYTIVVDKVPSCDCPHARKGYQCKHIIYVLARVLRVRQELEYQLAFLPSELRELFAKAPPLPSEQADETEKDGNRKPLEGECPICCVDFEPELSGAEEVVYCKAACGNNVHKECSERWAATKKGGEVTCPFCRASWEEDRDQNALKRVAQTGSVNEDGYVNVASQLGLSGERDCSGYNEYWRRRQFGYD